LRKNTFYIETYGCTSNKADSYIISDVLKKLSYVQTNIEDAEFIVINTCAVKQQTENKIKQRLKELESLYHENPKKHIIIAGCLPHITPDYIDVIKKIIPNYSAIIDLDNINVIPKIFQEIEKGKKGLVFYSKGLIDKAEILIDHPPGKITGIIPISEGCLGACTYCCVKFARGSLTCYKPQNIVENIKHQLDQGIKQIYLTSQDCSIYEYEGKQLEDLINKITNLEYKFLLRIGMINPSFLVNSVDQLLSIFQSEKVYQFLHIPIQSGSDIVLKKMNRTYTISEIKPTIETLREKFPYLTISTDIICGFPGASERDFQESVELIEWLKPEIINISKFTPRPGTKAKEMTQLDNRVIKERSIRLSKIFRNSLIEINQKWKDWEGEILVLHKGTEDNQVFGRNFAYKNVFLNDYIGDLGTFLNVKIEKVEGFNLFGKLV
jgi:MiaB-like tRNA modifying enzyme